MVPIRLKLEIIYQKGIILYPNVNDIKELLR